MYRSNLITAEFVYSVEQVKFIVELGQVRGRVLEVDKIRVSHIFCTKIKLAI